MAAPLHHRAHARVVHRARARVVRLAVLALAAAGFCLVAAGVCLVAWSCPAWRARPAPADLAVVFGNTVAADGRPSPRLRARLETARQLFDAGLVHRVIVSGGIEQPGHRDEAAAMAAYLAGRGVPPAAIIADRSGRNTDATARDTAALAPLSDRVIVVTQWFHVPRAMLAMRRAGFRHVAAAWPRYVEWRDLYSVLREAVALPVYALRPARAFRPGGGAAPRPPPPAP